MLRLKVYDGQERIQEVELRSQVVTIGREPENTLVLPDASVSRRHAQVEPNGNFFLLRDHGSTNGTFVNETLVRVQILSHGDTIRLGKYILKVDSGRKNAQETTKVRVESLRLVGQGTVLEGPTGAGEGQGAEPAVAAASRERLLRLYDIQARMAYVDTTQGQLERALDIILAEMGARRGSVLLPTPAADASGATPGFRSVAVRTRPRTDQAPPEQGEIVIPGDLLVRAISRAHGALWNPGEGSIARGSAPALAAPLREREKVRGVVYVERSPDQEPFAEQDLLFLAAICSQAAIALANAELFEEISIEREKLHAVFTTLSDGVLVTDLDFRVQDANAATAYLLDLQWRIPHGATLFDLFGKLRLSPESEVIRRCAAKEGVSFFLTRDATEPRDSDRNVIAGYIQPYPEAGAEARGLIVVLRDRSDAQRVEALKSQFLGNVAHKLRTPLTVIQGNLPILREEVTRNGTPAEILEEVERSSRSLCQIVDQFIEYTELEIKSLRSLTAPEPVRLKGVLVEAIRAVEAEACRKSILVVNRVRDESLCVSGRRDLLTRAIRQILDNAVKFCQEGARVCVQAEAGAGYVRLDFLDDGPGIPRSQAEAIFDACHQVDVEKTGQVPGAGLGLTIARHVVRQHGGAIEVTSPYGSPGRGTRVSVRLPTSVEQVSMGAGQGARIASTVEGVSTGHPVRPVGNASGASSSDAGTVGEGKA